MKTLIWKLRFCLALRRLLRCSWGMCWYIAGLYIDQNSDLYKCPIECAKAEYDSWTNPVYG